jgi:YVTN family beta-propeller protein
MSTGPKQRRCGTGPAWHLSWVGTLFVLSFLVGFSPRDSSGVASTQTGPTFEDRDVRYLSPVAMALSPDGRRLYVVCEESDLVLAVGTRTGSVIQRVQVGRKPKGIAISPDGKTLYVTNEWENTIAEIDADTFHVQRTLHTGWGPVGITTDRAGKFLYVANTLGNNISVIDLAAGREIKRLDAGHFPEYVTLSRDGKRVFVSNLLVRVEPFDKPPLDELTVVDTAKQEVAEQIPIPGVIQLRHIAELPAAQGGYLIIPFMRPKNLNPLIQVQQGWYMTHGIALVKPSATDAPGQRKPVVAELLLDDVDQYFADGFGAAATPDGRLALVTASGANVVSIINTAKLNLLRRRVPAKDPEALANRLDAANQFVVDRLKTGRNPTDVVVSPNGKLAYIANRTDDTVSVVDLEKLKIASTIDLGGPRVITPQRRGAQVFFDASYCYQGQMACASCHPHEGLSDGLAWSLETPRLGRDVVENRTLLDIGETSPFKWNGHNVDLAMQDGPRTAMYIFRSQGFSAGDVRDLVTYMENLQLPPNPRVPESGHLTDAQERGREIFFRTRTNTGVLIPFKDRCYYCHAPATHYTSRVAMDVGTATEYDTIKEFDIPQLDGVYMRPPFLHNGEALTLEEIWTKFNPKDQHGITSDMDKVQLNDLIEYLKTF